VANKYLLWIIIFVLVLLPNVALASVTEQPKEQPHTGVFGIITKDHEGEEKFEITNSVPFVEGQSYGWIIRLGPGITKVKWKEVFELPARPETWGPGELSEEHDISEDRKISITEKEVVAKGGYIQNFWSVAAGDPLGDYVIRVYVHDLLLETFYFTVLSPILSKNSLSVRLFKTPPHYPKSHTLDTYLPINKR
jgi:hypothetical protein|tara:strand:+ start:188 stop:769 length:582 start_codon:yes stop_codon:yes gene_type:complete